MSHQHDHGRCHDHEHGEAHDHSDDIVPAIQHLLYDQIDFDSLLTFNEEAQGSGRAIVQKPYAQRLDTEPELKSDVDEQLLMQVPFAGAVKLHSVLLRTSNTSSAPKTLKLYQNCDDLDFPTATELAPTQTLQLAQTSEVQDFPVRRALFNNTRSLTLFFEDNFGGGNEEVTRISYLAFKGEFTKLNREPIAVAYEAAANPKDHAVIKGTGIGMGSSIGGGGRDGM